MLESTPLVLKFEDWPQADRSAWDALFAGGDIFDASGPCRHWSEGSRQKRQQGYSQWLSFLMRKLPEAFDLQPVERVTQSRVRAYLEECQERLKPKSTAGLVLDLLTLAQVMGPQTDWAWLQTVVKRLSNKANTHSLPAPYPITAAEIFRWSLSRMAEVEADIAPHPHGRAIRFRQALMIGFLIARPIRRRTLLGMLIGRHLQPITGGYDLRFQPEDTKDKKARNFLLPSDMVAPMRRYLEVHRPELLQGQTSDALWINQYGNPITRDGLSGELPKVTKRYLGVELRTHAFRHIAATSIAEFDPEHVNIIRDILGHATLDMAQKHYNRATGLSSCNGLQSIVEDICKSVPMIGGAKRVLTPPGGVGERE